MQPHRREFLGAVPAAAVVGAAEPVPAANSPAVRNPRATSGDLRFEPVWEERFTVSVGNSGADLNGSTERVIQAAVDAVARAGGGTVKILPGSYRFRNAVYLASHVRVLGSGPDTVITKEPSVTSKLAADSDWYDQEITLADAKGFQVGDGICLRARNPHHGGDTVIKRTLIARSGSRFKVDKGLRENLWSNEAPTASTLFPLFSGEFITHFAIENLTLDGNKANNANLDGNYAGCIFLQDCANVEIRKVVARNYNGDGISWQICHDVVVDECESRDHTGLGMHPGSGSQRPVMRKNKLIGNNIGLFFCWGVKFGLAEGNVIEDTKTAGISVGHRDTDNIIRGNVVKRSGVAGILFRPERGAGFTGDRNEVVGNRIEDSGNESAAAIDVQGTTANLTFRDNTIVESRGAAKRVGIRIGKDARDISMEGNRFTGFATDVEDRRAK